MDRREPTWPDGSLHRIVDLLTGWPRSFVAIPVGGTCAAGPTPSWDNPRSYSKTDPQQRESHAPTVPRRRPPLATLRPHLAASVPPPAPIGEMVHYYIDGRLLSTKRCLVELDGGCRDTAPMDAIPSAAMDCAQRAFRVLSASWERGLRAAWMKQTWRNARGALPSWRPACRLAAKRSAPQAARPHDRHHALGPTPPPRRLRPKR